MPSPPSDSLLLRFKRALGADLRSVAVLRVGLGLLIITDLFQRSFDLRVHYTDYGLLPRGPLVSHFMNELAVCIHLCTGTLGGVIALFVLQGAVALCLMVGWRSRSMSVLSWFLMYSLHLRNPVVLQGGDDLLRMLLFWAMFLPLGARYSVDAALADEAACGRRSAPQDAQIFSVGTLALIAQLLLMYWSTAILKYGREWHDEGSAVYYALHYDQLALAPAVWLRQFYPLTVGLTHLTLFWESVGPALLITPFFFGPLRTFAACNFILMHHCFGLCLMLGLFPYIDMVSMLALMPAWAWDKLQPFVPRAAQRQTTVYFDAECGVCKKLVFILRELLICPEVAIAPAQGRADVLKRMQADRSWVVVDEAGAHSEWAGFVALARVSPLLGWAAGVLAKPAVARLGRLAYRAVADRRALLSATTARLLPWRQPANHTPWGVQLGGLAVLVVICNWNIAGWPRTLLLFPDALRPFAYMLRIDQDWGMFAPFPQKEDGWYVIQGKQHDGKMVDVYNQLPTPPSFDKPALVSDQYPNQRWSKYMMNIWLARNADYRLYYGQHLCRRHNGVGTPRGPGSLDEFEIFFVKEMTLPNYKSSPPERVSIWKHYCYEVPKTS